MNIFNMIRNKFGEKSGSVTINGQTFTGNEIKISATGTVIVDGVIQDGEKLAGPITVNITGDIEHVTNTSGNINVTGDAKIAMTTSGNINVKGDVKSNASTTSGKIDCSAVHGHASTVSGNISRKLLK